jgi:hypothetical protein
MVGERRCGAKAKKRAERRVFYRLGHDVPVGLSEE